LETKSRNLPKNARCERSTMTLQETDDGSGRSRKGASDYGCGVEDVALHLYRRRRREGKTAMPLPRARGYVRP
jgi:hypothetical protein